VLLRALPIVVAVAAAVTQVSPTRTGISIRYVANAGMLVTVNETAVLIDAPIRDGISPYPTSPTDERARLERAEAPYDRVAAILITHWHEDHFSPEAIAAHLAAQPQAIVVSSPEVVERVRAAGPGVDAARLKGVLPPAGQFERVMVGRLPVHVLRIRHNPARRLPEQHVGFLVGEDAGTVLHVGDADPAADNFAVLRALPRVQVALLPYWYVLDEVQRAFVASTINPRQVVAMHMPVLEAANVSEKIRGAALPITLPGQPGSYVHKSIRMSGSGAPRH
jgi:L-ascorbate metabolism protein UlaG (beta-lactamase superfamily)